MVKKIILGLATASLLFSSEALACKKMDNMMMSKMQHKKGPSHGHLVDDVVSAVSKTGLSAEQTLKVAEGVAEYKATMRQIKQMKIFPVDSFINDNFDEKKFILEMSEKSQAKIAAKAALFKYIFSILNDEQRKIFKREFAAPMIEHMVKMAIRNSNAPGMGMGMGMNQNAPKACKSCNMQ